MITTGQWDSLICKCKVGTEDRWQLNADQK